MGLFGDFPREWEREGPHWLGNVWMQRHIDSMGTHEVILSTCMLKVSWGRAGQTVKFYMTFLMFHISFSGSTQEISWGCRQMYTCYTCITDATIMMEMPVIHNLRTTPSQTVSEHPFCTRRLENSLWKGKEGWESTTISGMPLSTRLFLFVCFFFSCEKDICWWN